MKVKKFVMQASIILSLSLIIGIAYNGLSKSPLPILKKYNPIQAEDQGDKNVDNARPVNINEIDVETLKYLMESEEILLIDARTREEFNLGHLPNAVNLPVYEFDQVYSEVEGLFSEGKTIITYCSSETCIDSPLLAKKLYTKGYQDIFVYRGGFKEWTELNNPVEEPQEKVEE